MPTNRDADRVRFARAEQDSFTAFEADYYEPSRRVKFMPALRLFVPAFIAMCVSVMAASVMLVGVMGIAFTIYDMVRG